MKASILHIISTMDPKAGGVSQAVKTMVKGLQFYKITSHIVSLDDDYVRDSYPDFELITIGRATTSWSYNVRLTDWLKSNVASYESVIVHGLWQYQCYAILKNMPIAGNTKVYVMPHGMLDPYFQRAEGRRLKAIRNKLIWAMIEQKLVRKADGLLFTCETEKLLAHETFKRYYPQRELVVGLGVEKDMEGDATMANEFLIAFPQIKSVGYWLFISRIHPKKGLDLLIHAYLRLKAKHQTSVPQLVIAGPGLDTSYGESVMKLATGDPDIIFTDMLRGRLKWGAFYGCEAFVLPSHQENFGIAVVEALSCAKPVLISNQVNIWREIQQEGGGLVASDNADGIVDLLERWLQLSLDKREDMAKFAERTYHKYFTVHMAAKRLRDALKDVYEA